jgi:hypothetical protein
MTTYSDTGPLLRIVSTTPTPMCCATSYLIFLLGIGHVCGEVIR